MREIVVRVLLAAAIVFFAAACANDSVDESINAGSGPVGEGSGAEGYEFGRIRGGEVRLDGTRPEGGVFYVDGSTVYVNFPGEIGNIEEDPCVSQYDMTAEETADDVKVTLYYLVAKNPPPDAGCDSDQPFATMSVDLTAPLGERTLSTGTHIVNPAFSDALRSPTWVPESWVPTTRTLDPIRGGSLSFGADVYVEIQAMADKFGVEIVRGNPRHVDVNILGVDDGAVVTRERSGEHRLGFEEAGWFYDFVAQPNVDRDELIEFARGFAEPGVESGLKTIAVADQPWFVVSDTGLYDDEGDRAESEILETVEFVSIDGHDTIRLSSGCDGKPHVIEWDNDGFTTGEIMEDHPGALPCGNNFENFATSTIPPGTRVAVTHSDQDLVLTTGEETGGWTLELSRVALRLRNEIGQQLLDYPGWQYNDGAGSIDRSGISFPSEGSDEGLRFSSDKIPADVITLVTGCKVAAYRIAWNEDGFIVNSTFTSKGPTDGQACDYEATEGLVVTPLTAGQQILVTRDESGQVTLTPADPSQTTWTITLS